MEEKKHEKMAEEYKASKQRPQEVEERLHFRFRPLLLLSSIFVSMNRIFHIEHHVSPIQWSCFAVHKLAKYMESKTDKDRAHNSNQLHTSSTTVQFQFNWYFSMCLFSLVAFRRVFKTDCQL